MRRSAWVPFLFYPWCPLGCGVDGAENAGGTVDERDDSGAGSGNDDSGGGNSGGGDSGDDAGGSFDACDLAPEVSEAELRATIEALASLGTRYTYTDGDEAAADYLVGRFEALGVAVERHAFTLPDGTPAENVVARIDGATTPEAVYVFSAHYDSTSNDPETLAPGADDNASGVAAVLEACRLLSTHPLDSSAWFVLTGAEEQGSYGSAALAETWEADGTDVRGVIAPDMMAYWPLGDEDAFDILGDEASEPLVQDMAAVADTLGVANKTWIEHNYCYGDDHTSYQDAGFLAISPMDCVEAHNDRRSDEATPHYHRTTDTPDTLHLPFTTRVTQVTTVTFARWVGVQP